MLKRRCEFLFDGRDARDRVLVVRVVLLHLSQIPFRLIKIVADRGGHFFYDDGVRFGIGEQLLTEFSRIIARCVIRLAEALDDENGELSPRAFQPASFWAKAATGRKPIKAARQSDDTKRFMGNPSKKQTPTIVAERGKNARVIA